MYKCDIETTHLCSHIQTVHNREKIRKYQCNLCEYTNINKTQMDTHKNKVHLGIRIKCEFFDNLYGSKYNMHRHVDEKHKSIPKKIKVFKCSECPKVFTTSGSLTVHYKPVHEGVRYECKMCEYKATQKNDLKRHEERTHFPKYQTCSICSKQNTNVQTVISKLKMNVI